MNVKGVDFKGSSGGHAPGATEHRRMPSLTGRGQAPSSDRASSFIVAAARDERALDDGLVAVFGYRQELDFVLRTWFEELRGNIKIPFVALDDDVEARLEVIAPDDDLDEFGSRRLPRDDGVVRVHFFAFGRREAEGGYKVVRQRRYALQLASLTVPFGRFEGCLKTEETTHLEPDVLEHKYYCPGLGHALTVDLEAGGARFELTVSN